MNHQSFMRIYGLRKQQLQIICYHDEIYSSERLTLFHFSNILSLCLLESFLTFSSRTFENDDSAGRGRGWVQKRLRRQKCRKKMTTPSRKLRHTAKAPLTVFRNVILRLYEVFWCFAKFYNFFVIFGGQTERPTDLGIKAPSRSLKKVHQS